MRKTNRAAAFTAVLTGLLTALAVATPADAGPNCNVPRPPPICDTNPDKPTDPPPGHTPELALDGAEQTTDRAAVRIWGWTADTDRPRASLSVRFTVDGTSVGSMIANQSRPDVANAFPSYGAAHGFDFTVQVSAAQHDICVTATSVGGGDDRTACRPMNDIATFEANDISYDTSRAVLTNQTLEQLDKVTNVNNTNVQQSTEISGSKSTNDTKSWSSEQTTNISASANVEAGIPLFVEGKVNVSTNSSTRYTHNGSVATTQQFSWRQPVVVPARSRIEATVAITHFTISVPYTLIGTFVFRNGVRVPGTIGGVFTGGNSTNLVVNLQQFDIDGSPAAAPVRQPAATLLKATSAR